MISIFYYFDFFCPEIVAVICIASRDAFPRFFPAQRDLPETVPEVQDGKTDPGVNPDPLAGNGNSHKKSGKCQRNQCCPDLFRAQIDLHKPQHEEIGKNDKEYRKAVNCRDLCLRKMHAVKRHQSAGESSRPCLLGKLFCQQIDAGQHEDSGQRAGKTPPERSHAEYHDTTTDQDLSERRMARLIGHRSFCKFISGPCVIDLIKISTVPPAWLRFSFLLLHEDPRKILHCILFVKQIRRIRIQCRILKFSCTADYLCRNDVTFCIPENDFIQCQAYLTCRQANITSAEMDDRISSVVV